MKPKKRDSESWSDLAVDLGVTRTTLRAWRARPDAPKTREPADWLAYVAQHGLGAAGNRVSNEREAELVRNLRALRRINEVKAAQAEGRICDRGEVDALLLHHSSLARAILYAAFETEAPPRVVGLSAVEIRVTLAEMADRVVGILNRGHEKFREDYPVELAAVDGATAGLLTEVLGSRAEAERITRGLREARLLALYYAHETKIEGTDPVGEN